MLARVGKLAGRSIAVCLALSLGLSVCLPRAVLAAAVSLQGTLVLAPACDPQLDPDADCVLDSIGSGKFLITGSDSPGHRGLAFSIAIDKALKDGEKANLSDLEVAFLLSLDGSSCAAFFSPPFSLTDGRVRPLFTFGGGATAPPVPRLGTSRVELCGDRVALIAHGAGGDEIVAVDGLVQGPVRARTNLRGNILLNPACDPKLDADADCAVDSIKPGKFLVRSSSRGADNGLSFKIALTRAAKAGQRLSREGVRVVFSLSTDGGSCFDYLSPRLDLVNGKLRGKTRFSGGETFPPVAPSPAGTVALCGDGVQVFVPGSNGADSVAVAGLLSKP